MKELANVFVRLWFSMKIRADQEMFLLTGKRLCYFLLKNNRRKTEGVVSWSASAQPLVRSLDKSFAVCVAHELHIPLQSISKYMKVKKVIRSSQMDLLSANHD